MSSETSKGKEESERKEPWVIERGESWVRPPYSEGLESIFRRILDLSDDEKRDFLFFMTVTYAYAVDLDAMVKCLNYRLRKWLDEEVPKEDKK